MSFFTRLLTQSHPPDSPIAPQPHLTSLRSMRMLFLIFTVMMLVVLVSDTLIGIVTLREASFPWQSMFVPIMYLCFIGYSFWAEQWWKRLEVLRLAAAQGDDHLLAYDQPQPNIEALNVPVKIATRLSRKGLLVFGFLGGFLLIGLADTWFLLTTWPQHFVDFSICPWLLSLTVFVGAAIAFVLAVLWRHRWMIEVTQEGIRSRVKIWGMSEIGSPLMFWHEARLFAYYRKPIPWNNRSTLVCELSSASHIITWTWVQENKPLRIGRAPTIPFEEYQAQMHALCALVTAKTGLPLHDLSARQGVPPIIRD